MDRRRFLKALGLGTASAATAMVLDPELALWTPGAKTFFIPKALPDRLVDECSGLSIRLVKDYQFVTPELLARETLEMLRNNLSFSKEICRRYDELVIRCGAIISPPRLALI